MPINPIFGFVGVALRPPPVADKGSKALSEITSNRQCIYAQRIATIFQTGRYYPPDLMKFYVLSKCFKAIKSNVYLNAMRSIRMRLRTVGCPMNVPTDNSKFVPLKWFVFIIKYLAITCGRIISAPTSRHICFVQKVNCRIQHIQAKIDINLQ